MSHWVRKGECTHCGYCCTVAVPEVTVAYPTAKFQPSFSDDYWKVRGVKRTTTRDGTQLLQFTGILINPCPKLDASIPTAPCTIYESRPDYCRTWPTVPEQIKGTPCTYWFEEVEARDGHKSDRPLPGEQGGERDT